jgi:hypothetical protein
MVQAPRPRVYVTSPIRKRYSALRHPSETADVKARTQARFIVPHISITIFTEFIPLFEEIRLDRRSAV